MRAVMICERAGVAGEEVDLDIDIALRVKDGEHFPFSARVKNKNVEQQN